MSLFNKRNLSRGAGLKNQSKEFNNFLDELCDKLEIEIVSTGETFKDDHQIELGDIFEIVGKKNLYIVVDEEEGDEFKFYFTFFKTENKKFDYDSLEFLYAKSTRICIEFVKYSDTYWENDKSLIKDTRRIQRSIYIW